VANIGETIPVDILINNAGLGRAIGSLLTADIADIEMTVDTNVTAAIHMVRTVLPGMVSRRKGHIVNMSSVLALYPAPSSLYGATKGAMHKLSRDLRQELQGTGIRVTEINPGRVTTEFYDVAIDDADARADMQDTGIEEVTPADVAASIVHVLDAPWRVNISQLEIVPTEQSYGGSQFTPVDRSN
jgi:NADP-dependent 3-hydroxy acid dehydrogenase YdfG